MRKLGVFLTIYLLIFSGGILQAGDRPENLRPGANAGVCENLFAAFSSYSSYGMPTWQEAQAHNATVVAGLDAAPIPPFNGRRFTALNFSQAQGLFYALANDPVAAQAVKPKYDPTGCMGFCFGRATAGHLLGLFEREIHPASFLKLYMVGNLRAPFGSWRYHVTLLTKALETEGWWALDTSYSDALPFKNWIQQMQQVYDPDGNALLFATTPKRVGPDPNSKYSPEAFYLPEYNGYFRDLLQRYQSKFPPR